MLNIHIWWLVTGACDLRCGIDRLLVLVQQLLGSELPKGRAWLARAVCLAVRGHRLAALAHWRNNACAKALALDIMRDMSPAELDTTDDPKALSALARQLLAASCVSAMRLCIHTILCPMSAMQPWPPLRTKPGAAHARA